MMGPKHCEDKEYPKYRNEKLSHPGTILKFRFESLPPLTKSSTCYTCEQFASKLCNDSFETSLPHFDLQMLQFPTHVHIGSSEQSICGHSSFN